jgi:hypothetical protein
MMVDVYNAALYKQNRTLAILTRDERNRLLAKLKPINLEFAEVLYQTAATINRLYFPLTAVVSTVAIIGERKVSNAAPAGSSFLIERSWKTRPADAIAY